MKKPKITTKKTTPKAEQPVKSVVTKTTPKKPVKTVVTKEKSKKPAKTTVTKAKPKKTSPVPTPPKKAQTVTPKPVAATPERTVPERIGLTAGSIWHYLTENGATSVAKLLRELSEDEKIIQRSIGWLAQEGKITLDTINRVETIVLKG